MVYVIQKNRTPIIVTGKLNGLSCIDRWNIVSWSALKIIHYKNGFCHFQLYIPKDIFLLDSWKYIKGIEEAKN